MKQLTILSAMAVCLLFSAGMTAQPKCKLLPTETIMLYPEGQDSGKGIAGAPGESNGIKEAEVLNPNGNLANTGDSARVDLYIPKKCKGTMVVVCPGGGYQISSTYNEGLYVADWLLKQNVAVAVVKYRMPNGHWNVPLTDIQNVFRYCRAHAKEWKVKRIGVMGFSAGGHLAATVSNMFVDEQTRPDFSILYYPVITMDEKLTHKGTMNNLVGYKDAWKDKNDCGTSRKELLEKYSMEKRVSKNTPKTIIFSCQDDGTVPVENSLMYYNALLENKVPAEMYIYPTGGHGWGFSSTKFVKKDHFKYARQEMEATLARFLKEL